MPSSSEMESILLNYAKDLVNATSIAMKETMNKIGQDSTDGMVKYTKTKNSSGKFDRVKNSYGITRLNKSSKLRVQSGNLIRSLINPTDKNSIRKITVANSVVTGLIGSEAKSEDGFGYPAFHEFGQGRNGQRYAYFLTNAIRKNERFLKERLIFNINRIKII